MEQLMPDTVLKPGDVAPEFALMNQDKNVVKLSDYRGKRKVMLLFYPMDFSPVCTDEHCAFAPELEKIIGAEDAVVFGVSCDSPFCHEAFRKQYDVPYDLLSDVTRKMVKAYGMFAGEEPFNCSKRGTVVIDKEGKISYVNESPILEKRTVDSLANAVLADIEFEQRANEFGEGTASR
jgi:peroxiredoxin